MNTELKLIGKPYVYRYRGDNEYTLDEIKNNYIYFANREELNDPFDSSPYYLDLTQSIKELHLLRKEVLNYTTDPLTRAYIKGKQGLEEVQKIATEKIEEFVLSFGIACFSMHQINYNLWANYANNYKGVCLQYNTDNDLDFFYNLLPVLYVPEIKKTEFKPITQPNEIVKLFYYKLDSWNVEKELRLIKNNCGKIQHDKRALRNVIIGYKAEENFVKNILFIIKNHYTDVGVYRMEKPRETNKASYTQLK